MHTGPHHLALRTRVLAERARATRVKIEHHLEGVGTAGTGAVTGETTTPVTSPFTASLCFGPIVCRAARVAARFATAAVFSSVVRTTRDRG